MYVANTIIYLQKITLESPSREVDFLFVTIFARRELIREHYGLNPAAGV